MDKFKLIKEAINLQLGNFAGGNNVKIPIILKVDNKKCDGAVNVFEVSSIKEVEEISMELIKEINFIDEIKDYSEPLFLTVIASLPLRS